MYHGRGRKEMMGVSGKVNLGDETATSRGYSLQALIVTLFALAAVVAGQTQGRDKRARWLLSLVLFVR